MADVNGDGRADLIGFGTIDTARNDVWDLLTYVALGKSDGSFTRPEINAVSGFSSDIAAGGWTSYNEFPRAGADVTGDGRADIIGFASDGIYIAQSRDYFV